MIRLPTTRGAPFFAWVSLTRWTWVWASSRSWWWTGKPGMLQSMGSQNRTWLSDWTELILKLTEQPAAASPTVPCLHKPSRPVLWRRKLVSNYLHPDSVSALSCISSLIPCLPRRLSSPFRISFICQNSTQLWCASLSSLQPSVTLFVSKSGAFNEHPVHLTFCHLLHSYLTTILLTF